MRPVLLAMNNPLSSDPEHALYPWPEGCTGHRLWMMLTTYAIEWHSVALSQHDYLRAFERRNLLSRREWSARDARAAATELTPLLYLRRVVVLGASTAKALELRRREWGAWTTATDCDPGLFGNVKVVQLPKSFDYCVLPHPSGRCREYNDPAMRELAGRTLWELYRMAVPA